MVTAAQLEKRREERKLKNDIRVFLQDESDAYLGTIVDAIRDGKLSYDIESCCLIGIDGRYKDRRPDHWEHHAAETAYLYMGYAEDSVWDPELLPRVQRNNRRNRRLLPIVLGEIRRRQRSEQFGEPSRPLYVQILCNPVM